MCVETGPKLFLFSQTDYRKLNVYNLCKRLRTVGFSTTFRAMVLSGISCYSPAGVCFLVGGCIRSLDANLSYLNIFDKVELLERRFRDRVRLRRRLRDNLFVNNLPCNGQRTRTNARTTKRRRAYADFIL